MLPVKTGKCIFEKKLRIPARFYAAGITVDYIEFVVNV